MSINELVNNGRGIFDGAMGTYLASKDSRFTSRCEIANVAAPEMVKNIHKEYIKAGSQVITANTFAVNRFNYSEKESDELLRAGWDIAEKAAGESDDAVQVIASIGPVIAEKAVKIAEYKWIADILIDAGARNFIFETQSSAGAVIECAKYIKDKLPDAFVGAAFSINDSGFTAEGSFAGDILKATDGSEDIDAAGFNCGCSASYMQKTILKLKTYKKPLIVMPNAGYMFVVNRKTVYKGAPSLFADKTAQMARMGAVIVGGCCGTTPDHIRMLKEMLESETSVVTMPTPEKNAEEKPATVSRFFEKLVAGEKPIAVELDPPADADTTKFIKGVEELKDVGADIITIADCPIGRARMDSSLLACKVQREFGIEALPHMTCRDRNLNATQALILGLYAEGVRNLLIVTGDPVPSAEKDAVKSVYQFNSRKFAAFAASLRERMLDENMHFFGALNVNARNFDVQINLAKEKLENGISGFLTQPVLTPEAFENLKRARKELDGFILGGIIPVVSEKNARFMDSEISGINVDPKVTEMYVGKDREEAEELAVSISTEIASSIAPYVDGYYLMTPFQRTSLMRKIIEKF